MNTSDLFSFHMDLLYEINKKKCDSSSCFHNTTSAEFMDKFQCLPP